jgi:hypothetical protein
MRENFTHFLPGGRLEGQTTFRGATILRNPKGIARRHLSGATAPPDGKVCKGLGGGEARFLQLVKPAGKGIYSKDRT